MQGQKDKGQTGSFQFPKVEILMKTKLLRSALFGPRLSGGCFSSKGLKVRGELCDAKKWGWKAYDSGGIRARLVIEMTGYMDIHWKNGIPDPLRVKY